MDEDQFNGKTKPQLHPHLRADAHPDPDCDRNWTGALDRLDQRVLDVKSKRDRKVSFTCPSFRRTETCADGHTNHNQIYDPDVTSDVTGDEGAHP